MSRKSVHSVLPHLGYNSSPLIILSVLPCFSQKRLKEHQDVILFSDKGFSMCQMHAMHIDQKGCHWQPVQFY